MQQPQQPMGANMAGYGNMPPNQGMMGAPAPGMPNNQQNNGNMRGQGEFVILISRSLFTLNLNCFAVLLVCYVFVPR